MGATKARRSSSKSKEPAGLLTRAARTIGQAAGQAAKAIGLDHPDSSAHAPAAPKKRPSARAQRKNRAEKARSAAEAALSKSSTDLGAPYRRVMGKPTGNWTNKDIDYVNGIVAKQGA